MQSEVRTQNLRALFLFPYVNSINENTAVTTFSSTLMFENKPP
jgi:hypothetical protein